MTERAPEQRPPLPITLTPEARAYLDQFRAALAATAAIGDHHIDHERALERQAAWQEVQRLGVSLALVVERTAQVAERAEPSEPVF